jgi:hypothetical protein
MDGQLERDRWKRCSLDKRKRQLPRLNNIRRRLQAGAIYLSYPTGG